MSEAEAEADAEPTGPSDRRRLRWWREVVYIAVFYSVYSFIRNTQGSAAVSAERAFANAREVIRIEEALGLYFEQALQEAFLEWRLFIQLWNVFYGTFHFVVTIAALVLLFRRFPARYPRWRNALAATTGLALIGFATYPLMPPRLLPPEYGFVDTLRVYGGLWSFDSGPVAEVSNQYAAMPSLHFAWSAWCTFVLYPMVVRPWARLAVALYPAATLFAIVVTANHYWLDAAGGALVLAAGTAAAFALAATTGAHPGEEAVPNRASVT
ncbi:MAG: phosphatase PAP2 family protein [Actinomycetota bacterium]|nr:phosphatase PAP2 family protein [Actinomycetota bacterium]